MNNIINTIKSRAQLIKIPKLSNKEIEKALTEKNNYSSDIARKVSKLSDGNYIESLKSSTALMKKKCISLNSGIG